jgi:hypothetical protein
MTQADEPATDGQGAVAHRGRPGDLGRWLAGDRRRAARPRSAWSWLFASEAGLRLSVPDAIEAAGCRPAAASWRTGGRPSVRLIFRCRRCTGAARRSMSRCRNLQLDVAVRPSCCTVAWPVSRIAADAACVWPNVASERAGRACPTACELPLAVEVEQLAVGRIEVGEHAYPGRQGGADRRSACRAPVERWPAASPARVAAPASPVWPSLGEASLAAVRDRLRCSAKAGIEGEAAGRAARFRSRRRRRRLEEFVLTWQRAAARGAIRQGRWRGLRRRTFGADAAPLRRRPVRRGRRQSVSDRPGGLDRRRAAGRARSAPRPAAAGLMRRTALGGRLRVVNRLSGRRRPAVACRSNRWSPV